MPYYEPGKYDVAILHIDQQCIDPMIGKGVLYRNLNKVIQDIPKIVINHGTPIWPEKWEGRNSWKLPYELMEKKDNQWIVKDKKEVEKYQIDFLINGGKTVCNSDVVEIDGMKKLVGNNTMVVNSFRAREQWGWGHTIWHGLNSDEWWDLPKEPRAIITQSPAGLDYYYNRSLLSDIRSSLAEDYGIHFIQVGHPMHGWMFDAHPRYPELGGWGAYKDYIGRSLIYINPTKESPMPRSRTEAMLSGCCVLSTPYHDADKFLNLVF